MKDDAALRKQLVRVLESDEAHAGFEDVIADFPVELRGKRPQGAPHSPWELLEHMRIAQWDILEFSRDGKHQSPKFPEGYWPGSPEPPSAEAWEKSVKGFLADRKELARLVADESAELFARIPHGSGQTLLREALLTADHNAYHLGQLVLVRRLLGVWPAS
jgi:hypothetical protein